MMHSRNYQRASENRRQRERFRALSFERCEDRRLLSVAPAAAIVAEVPVRFRMEVTDTTGTPINAVEAGNEFAVNVYVVDQRSLPQGVFAAYLDVLFDDSLVVRSGDVTFGESYTNALALGGSAPGILDEVGAVASLFEIARESAAVPDSLLFRAPFRAIDAGPVTFLTKPADHLPDSHVLLFGVNQPIEQGQIVFDTAALDITPSHASALSSTLTLPTTEFVSIPASSLTSETSSLAKADAFPPLITASWSSSKISLVTTSLPVLSTLNRDIQGGDERWRLLERSPDERSRPHTSFEYTPQTAENESGWIEIPFQQTPVWLPLSLPVSSHRESPLPRYEDFRHQVPSFNSRTGELTWQTAQPDFRQQNWTRAFLRMSWTAQEVSLLSSQDLLAAHMIDIDEILTMAVRRELPELNLDEFFAEEFDDETSDSLTDYCTELLRADIRLRAARGASLAIEVGMASSEPSIAEHSDVPDATADGEQGGATPPTSHADGDETAVASA